MRPWYHLRSRLQRDRQQYDEDHPYLGQAHFQYSAANKEDRWGITFEHETPSLILWEIVEELLEDVRSNYQYANEEP